MTIQQTTMKKEVITMIIIISGIYIAPFTNSRMLDIQKLNKDKKHIKTKQNCSKYEK